ncbi:MAG: pyridoxamine 5'-phosphate oxidase [Bacteroidales bacterium]
MQDKYFNLRNEYTLGSLNIEDLSKDPLIQFKNWFEDALKLKVTEPNAMTISTIGADCKPSSRTVLLKGIDDDGFVFFTNYNSRKATQLMENPNAALTFLWPEIQRQAHVEGVVEKISAEESDIYFNSRPKNSRIGAWISPQSSVIESRKFLEEKFEEFKNTYSDKEIKRPQHWGGFRLIPQRIEFWQGRENRLHDRILYEKSGNTWKLCRLAP